MLFRLAQLLHLVNPATLFCMGDLLRVSDISGMGMLTCQRGVVLLNATIPCIFQMNVPSWILICFGWNDICQYRHYADGLWNSLLDF